MINAKSRRGKNARGRKVTSIVPFPAVATAGAGDRVLVTTNDSRMRLYHVIDKVEEAKYSGHENTSSQIRAHVSEDGAFIITGSEVRSFVWRCQLRDVADALLNIRDRTATSTSLTLGSTTSANSRLSRSATKRRTSHSRPTRTSSPARCWRREPRGSTSRGARIRRSQRRRRRRSESRCMQSRPRGRAMRSRLTRRGSRAKSRTCLRPLKTPYVPSPASRHIG